MKNLLLYFSVLLIATPSLASKKEIPKDSDWLLLGLELGSQDKTDVTLPEVENEGTQIGIYGAYSKYRTDYVWDLGLGFRYDKMEDNSVTVETKAFTANLGVRYRLNSSWNLGPELQWLFGQDVSFSDTGTNSDDRNQVLFGGLRLMYDIYQVEDRDENILRLGLRAMQDLNIGERDMSIVQFLVEYNWALRRARKVIGLQKAPFLKLDLKKANIRFQVGKKELEPNSIVIVHQIGDILAKYKSEWEFIDIFGHTDSTGDYDKNVKLSWDRADFVKNELVSRGVPASRVDTKGFGPDKPIDSAKTPEAYSKNRRVEFSIEGDKASKKFIDELKLLFSKM
ncbi:MAG: OmpA family protein [Bdellovibrionales bacterium]